MDDFDRSNVSVHSGLDDTSYPGDPRRFVEVIRTSCLSCLSDVLNIFKFYFHVLLCLAFYLTNYL